MYCTDNKFDREALVGRYLQRARVCPVQRCRVGGARPLRNQSHPSSPLRLHRPNTNIPKPFDRATTRNLAQATSQHVLPITRLHYINSYKSPLTPARMEDFASETDSDYTSYWRDWVSRLRFPLRQLENFEEGGAGAPDVLQTRGRRMRPHQQYEITKWYPVQLYSLATDSGIFTHKKAGKGDKSDEP